MSELHIKQVVISPINLNDTLTLVGQVTILSHFVIIKCMYDVLYIDMWASVKFTVSAITFSSSIKRTLLPSQYLLT